MTVASDSAPVKLFYLLIHRPLWSEKNTFWLCGTITVQHKDLLKSHPMSNLPIGENEKKRTNKTVSLFYMEYIHCECILCFEKKTNNFLSIIFAFLIKIRSPCMIHLKVKVHIMQFDTVMAAICIRFIRLANSRKHIKYMYARQQWRNHRIPSYERKCSIKFLDDGNLIVLSYVFLRHSAHLIIITPYWYKLWSFQNNFGTQLSNAPFVELEIWSNLKQKLLYTQIGYINMKSFCALPWSVNYKKNIAVI